MLPLTPSYMSLIIDCDNMVELLTLSSTLDPKDIYKSLDVEKICDLITNFYPGDFIEQEKLHLRIQVQHYELDVPFHFELRNLSTIFELCQGLVKKKTFDLSFD